VQRNFVFPLPRFVLHPFTAASIAALHVDLAFVRLSKVFGGEVPRMYDMRTLGQIGGSDLDRGREVQHAVLSPVFA